MAKTNFLQRLRLMRDSGKIMSTIDHEALRSLREKYAGTPWYDSKHWDVRTRIAIALHHAYVLDLHRSAPQRILDLGTGCGFFPYVCNYFGHEASGSDVLVPMYRDVVDVLGVPWHQLEIRGCEPMPIPGEPYDLITAMLIFFDRHNKPDAWRVPEWKYFLKHAAKHQLRSGGRLYLVPVRNPESGDALPDELIELFRQYGARVEGNRADFHPLQIPIESPV